MLGIVQNSQKSLSFRWTDVFLLLNCAYYVLALHIFVTSAWADTFLFLYIGIGLKNIVLAGF